MTRERVCADKGLIVSGDTRLAFDLCEFQDDATVAPVGCGRLRCATCGEWVRSGPPGLTIKVGASIDSAVLYAAPNWADLAVFEHRTPGLRNGSRVRFYACKCCRWESDYEYVLGNERDSPNDPDLPWSCAGHPSPVLPVVLGGLTITGETDWEVIVGKILGGKCPRALELPQRFGDGPSIWLGWLFVYLRGLPAADDLSFAIAKRCDDNDPTVVGRVLFFFKRFSEAKGVELLVALSEADVHCVAIGYPIPEHYKASTLWDVLAARLALRKKGDEIDKRINTIVRRVVLVPLDLLSHVNLGPTDLVECERRLRVSQGWDQDLEFLQKWLKEYAEVKQGERIDVVASELERSPGAFDDADLRIFLADNILQINSAGSGRWKGVMKRLTDWQNKPEQGHLIVIAGARVIQAKLVSDDEFRVWMHERCAAGWRDDSWLLPLESMLGSSQSELG